MATTSTRRFAVVADAGCDLPAAWLEEHDVRVVPFHTVLDGRDYPDLGEEGTANFYVALATAREAPRVSAPTGLDYSHVFGALFDEGYERIVSVHVSSALSGSHAAALAAARLMSATDRVELVDSRTASVAEGIVVRDLVAARDAGAGARDAAAHARELAALTTLYVIPGHGRALGRDGRAPRGLRGALARLAQTMSGERQLMRTEPDGTLARVRSHPDLSYLASDLVRHLSLRSREVGPVVYAEASAGMPRYLEYVDRPLDTNEFRSERLWVANSGPAVVSAVGIGAIGVGVAPRSALWGARVAEAAGAPASGSDGEVARAAEAPAAPPVEKSE